MMQHPVRAASLDITRGLIVAIMALDHVRIYFAEAQFDPVDLSQTTEGYFFTRLVTHICAPGFFFIAGLGAWMSLGNSAAKPALARFLALRGLWLVVLDLTVMGVAWSFGFTGWFWFGVLWGLGASMIVLAALVFAPRLLLLVAVIATILFQEQWLALIPFEQGSINALFFTGGVWETPFVGSKIVLYPLMPWLALMALGYTVGPYLVDHGRPRAAPIFALGLLLLLGFAVARFIGYGGGLAADDPRPLLAFLNVEKYPPSLQFSLLTLGALLVFFGAVAAADRTPGSPAIFHPLRIFGSVPFFFYLLHIFLIHALALACASAFGWPREYLFWSGPWPNLVPPDGYGFGIPGIYAMWFATLALLYFACLWFAGVKARRKDWWLRYF